MKYTKVQDHSGLVRDNETNAVINTNMNEYNNYLNASRIKRQEKEKINAIEEQVNELKNDINEIKSLLIKLIDK